MKKLIVILCLGLFTTPAFSGGLMGGDKKADSVSFEQIDTDHDGAISKQEASSFSALEVIFESADRNKDGLLDSEEFADMRNPASAQ